MLLAQTGDTALRIGEAEGGDRNNGDVWRGAEELSDEQLKPLRIVLAVDVDGVPVVYSRRERGGCEWDGAAVLLLIAHSRRTKSTGGSTFGSSE